MCKYSVNKNNTDKNCTRYDCRQREEVSWFVFNVN